MLSISSSQHSSSLLVAIGCVSEETLGNYEGNVRFGGPRCDVSAGK